MKKLIITLLITTLSPFSFANTKYEKAMLKNIEAVYQAKTIEDYQSVINNLERIASTEKDKWEPYYYKTFSYIMMSEKIEEGSKKDQYLDMAQKELEKGLTIAPENSELVTLQGFIHTMRVVVDPPTRGQKYSGLAVQSLQQALQLNKDNPRALLLLGQMNYGTAKFFGSDTSEACGLVQKALDKFKSYQAKTALSPQWGKNQAEGMLKQCGE